MGDYRTECLRCGASVRITSLIVENIRGVILEADGFALSEAWSMDTTDERVECAVGCGWTGTLTDLMNTEG